MDTDQVRAILERVRAGELTPDAALTALRWAPFEDLGFARIDTHRQLRTGYPEVVFCQGKTVEQVVGIVRRLAEHSAVVLATRASAEQAEGLKTAFPEIIHHEIARVLELRREGGVRGHRPEGVVMARDVSKDARSAPAEAHASDLTPRASYVLVVAAGTSDMPVAEEAVVTAQALGSRVERLYDVGVAGLHRLLGQRDLLLGASVLVVVAGMEGALPSVVAGLIEQPVIAVPTSIGYGANFGGLAPLLAMLNSCATGIAVVNIDNGFGAGYFAHLVNQTVVDSRQPEVAVPGEAPDVRHQALEWQEERSDPLRGDAGEDDAPATSPDIGLKGGSSGSAAPDPMELPTTDYRLPSDTVTVLEANLDDLNPQIYDHVMDRLFAAGALDVTLTPIHMKKNRPGVTLSVISDPEKAETLAGVLFTETSTLGVRMSRWERLCLEREWVRAETPWGPVRVKIGRWDGQVMTRTPEYDDCKRVAQEAGVPLKEVQAAALRALLAPD